VLLEVELLEIGLKIETFTLTSMWLQEWWKRRSVMVLFLVSVPRLPIVKAAAGAMRALWSEWRKGGI
jgi:hypothetical protein